MITQTDAIPLIGITGTSGKTTAILMLQYLLREQGLDPAVMDAWKGPAAFKRLINAATDSRNSCILVEVPVEALRQKQLDGTVFNCAALTNLSADHLTTCGSEERYYRIKSGFLQQLPADAKAVIPADDFRALAPAVLEHTQFVTFSLHYPHAMVTAKNMRVCDGYPSFTLTVEAEFAGYTGHYVRPGEATVNLRMAGEHNVANALLAATLALLFTADIEAVAAALCRFPGIRRNMEVISANGCRIIDDGARNPASLRMALATAAQFKPRRTLLLHGIYGGGGQTINRCNARELAAWARRHPHNLLTVTRSMYHCKSRHHVRLAEEKAFLNELKENGVEFAYYPDLPDACESVLSRADKGDLILLAGGPVLNRAREVLLRAYGENTGGTAIIPTEMPPDLPAANPQPLPANPT